MGGQNATVITHYPDDIVEHGSVGHTFALSVDADELRAVLWSLGLPYLLAMLFAVWLIHSSTGLASRLDRLPWCAPALRSVSLHACAASATAGT